MVGSKNFTEQVILGEMFAQIIEARTHLPVERRFYLAGTFICQQAILAGRIDIYPEYTGTALTAVLKQQPSGDKQEVYQRVKQSLRNKFGLTVGPPLGFDDTFAMVIRGDDARRLHLQTLSQAAAIHSPVARRIRLRIHGASRWIQGPGGKLSVCASRKPPRIMDLGLITRALKEHQVDIIAGNNTDGLIPALDLFVLQDDHHYFPPYEAVAVMRGEMLKQHPEVGFGAGRVGGSDLRRRHAATELFRRWTASRPDGGGKGTSATARPGQLDFHLRGAPPAEIGHGV